MDSQSRPHNLRGEALTQRFKTAAFAEYVIVDQSQVVLIPSHIPLDRAALLACGVITGLGAVVNTARVRPRQSVVVIGTGGVGLNAIQGAVLVGADPIIAVDLLNSKLETAQAFGATHIINPSQQDLARRVEEITAGRYADYAFVTVGSSTAAAQALNLVRSGGMVVLVGIPHEGATVAVPIFDLVRNARRLIGSLMGSTRLQVDVPRLVELYQQGRLKLDELISARYPLEQINQAIGVMEQGESVRNMIVFD